MKRLALVLLAACGGSSTATQTTTTPTTTPSGEEDWRGYLSQIAGTPCRWVPGASFLACTTDTGTTLIGWEMTNRQYVAWRIEKDGNFAVLPGSASNAGWTFEGPEGRIALTRVDGTTWSATGLGSSDITLTVDPKANPGTVTPGPDANQDWRNELQALVATWTFSGTVGGAQQAWVEECNWVPSSTFILCRSSENPGVKLTGWEPHNRRYVQIRVDENGMPDVLAGTVANKNWTFTGSEKITLTRKSALEFEVRAEVGGAAILEGVYATKPGAVGIE